jgi:PHD/YefM family antitoxin component YafN of YafNO toxin-antitoxin module
MPPIVYKPKQKRGEIFDVMNSVLENQRPVQIFSSKNDGVVMVPMSDWSSIQELLFLEKTGTLDVVLDRMENESPQDFPLSSAL